MKKRSEFDDNYNINFNGLNEAVFKLDLVTKNRESKKTNKKKIKMDSGKNEG